MEEFYQKKINKRYIFCGEYSLVSCYTLLWLHFPLAWSTGREELDSLASELLPRVLERSQLSVGKSATPAPHSVFP